MIKKLILLCVALALTGCSAIVKTKIKEVPVHRVEYVFLTVPTHMLQVNEVPAPPAKNTYASATSDEKEDLLIAYSMELMTQLKMCVADKKAVSRVIVEKNKTTEQMNRPSKEQSQ